MALQLGILLDHLSSVGELIGASSFAAPPPMPDVSLNPPTNQQNTYDFLGIIKWICLMFLTAVAFWRVVQLGLSWRGGAPLALQYAATSLFGVLLAIYVLLNFKAFYDFFSGVIPF